VTHAGDHSAEPTCRLSQRIRGFPEKRFTNPARLPLFINPVHTVLSAAALATAFPVPPERGAALILTEAKLDIAHDEGSH
jgi:hypothetical protein